MNCLFFLLWIPIVLQLGLLAAIPPEKDLDSLVEAERAFAAASAEMGIKKAFCAYLSKEAVIFNPEAVNGLEWYEKRPETIDSLAWHPVYADISISNDFGYTTGPWVYEREETGDKVYGHYVSFWRKSADQPWRVVLDIGISHPKPETDVKKVESSEKTVEVMKVETNLNTVEAVKDFDIEEGKKTLLKADSAFDGDYAKAVAGRCTDDVRLYRMGALPVAGKSACLAALADEKAGHSWRPKEAAVSSAGDLGYTYGVLEKRSKPPSESIGRFSYLRIWRRQSDGVWKSALELFNPIPPPEETK